VKDNSPDHAGPVSSIPFEHILESARIIAENASYAIITIDQDSRILFANKTAETIFGYKPEELLGSQLTMLMPDYLRRLHRQGLKGYLETGEKHLSWESVSLPGLHKSGVEISLELSFGEFERDGRHFFTGIVRDVTLRKQNERRLNLQHEVTALLADANSLTEVAPELLKAICLNLDWHYAALWNVNQQINKLEYVANWHAQTNACVTEFAQNSSHYSFAPGQGFPGEIWKSKKPLWVEKYAAETYPRSAAAASVSLRSACGFPILLRNNVLGVIEVFSEQTKVADQAILDTFAAIGAQIGQFMERRISEVKREEALAHAKESQRKAETLTKQLESLQRITDVALAHLTIEDLISESLTRIREVLNVDTVAILLLRREGDEVVAWAAQGLEEEVELGVRIPVGKGFAGKVISEVRPIIIDDVSKADVHNPLLREKGIKSLLGVPLFSENKPIGVIHVGKLELTSFTSDDVQLLQLAADRISLAIGKARLYEVERTARKEAEDANRAKDDFLTILSHELRTPLTPIIGWVHMMQNGILPERDFNKGLSVIDRNADSLKKLINDILDMSAILSGKMRLETVEVNVTAVLHDAIETMRAYADESNIKLEMQASSRPLLVKGDRNRLHQVFCNILHNAIKFSPAGGTVHVKCDATSTEAIVTFSDEGQGISEQFMPHIFERFRQADSSRTRAYGGLGLGLALVKSFVEGTGGSVEADSPGEGLGSIFTVRLPRFSQTPQTKSGEPSRNLHDVQNRRCVLIVEDQQDTLDMLAAIFHNHGYRTLACISATEALATANREHFAILISDIAMPEMDGFQLIASLRKIPGLTTIPAIALSGYASEKDASNAISAGFNLHLSKPVDPIELVAAAEELLAATEKVK
jgi:PAS domain S-box-containing protein